MPRRKLPGPLLEFNGLRTDRGGGAEISEIEKAHESKGGERPDVRHFLFFFGLFNWPRNHDETEVKITMKSII